jgi:hypothetical protein
MRILFSAVLMTAAVIARADEIEPAVNTSSVPPAPPAASEPAPAATASTPSASPAKPSASATKPTSRTTTAAKPQVGQKSGARDEILLDPTQITGNKELPNVMYVVPWKRPDIGDLGGRPAKSLVDEVLAPVDRDVFRRQNRYFAALQAQTGAAPAKPTVAPAAGATITLPSKDEK